MRHLPRLLLAAATTWLSLRAWAALRPTAFPYFARVILEVRRPLLTRRAFVEILDPIPGERILEVGPGTGYYTFVVAERVGPTGSVDVLDVRQSFVDHIRASAARRGLRNVAGTQGDAGSLPFPDARFDAAYLVGVLGEIPDPKTALRELRRVLKPTGRLVVGEIFFDPDFTRLGWLLKQAEAAGLRFERRSGPRFAYFARFRPEEAQSEGHGSNGHRREAPAVASYPGGGEAVP
jgi:ubiquinone/menaquinone biosynthesis C-methylase UbiE